MFKIRFNKKIAFPPLAGSAVGVISNNSNLRFSVVRKVFYTFLYQKKGVVLLIVLGTLLVVASLATVILSLILSHSRLTHHQTSRIQAYYAAMAGVNYALEQLRTGSWIAGTNCPTGSPCTMAFDSGDFKPSILVSPTNGVLITITPYGSTGCTASPGNTTCVSAKTTYTYTP